MLGKKLLEVIKKNACFIATIATTKAPNAELTLVTQMALKFLINHFSSSCSIPQNGYSPDSTVKKCCFVLPVHLLIAFQFFFKPAS